MNGVIGEEADEGSLENGKGAIGTSLHLDVPDCNTFIERCQDLLLLYESTKGFVIVSKSSGLQEYAREWKARLARKADYQISSANMPAKHMG